MLSVDAILCSHLERLVVVTEVINVRLRTGVVEQSQIVPSFGLQAPIMFAGQKSF